MALSAPAMPVDWTLFVPVICMQKGTKYDGECYMERLRDIVKVNGRTVCKSDNLAKCDIQSGDVVVVQYRKSHFEGVVDFPANRIRSRSVRVELRGSTRVPALLHLRALRLGIPSPSKEAEMGPERVGNGRDRRHLPLRPGRLRSGARQGDNPVSPPSACIQICV